MAVVILKKRLTQQIIQKAREEYKNYIKITVDLEQEIIALGGEYRADAEGVLNREHDSKRSHIWGGGYNIETGEFETNALINIRQPNNPSMEIVDTDARENFLGLVKDQLQEIPDYL